MVATDHKPLLGIFGDRALDTIDNTRLVRIKQKTLPWNFDLVYVPGKQHVAADWIARRNQKAVLHLLAEIAEHGVRYKIHTLGKQAQVDNLRSYKPSNSPVFRNGNTAPVFRNGNTAPVVITWEMLKNSTAKDEVLDKVIKQALKGFPVSKHQLHRDVQPYHNYRHQLAITEGVLLYKSRVVIPMELREQVLQTLHAAHQGISGYELSRQDLPAVTEHVLPQHTPQAQESLKPGLQSDQLPEVSHTLQAEVRDPYQQNGHYYCHHVQENTPPQGPYKVGPPEPYSEASQKQTHFATWTKLQDLPSR